MTKARRRARGVRVTAPPPYPTASSSGPSRFTAQVLRTRAINRDQEDRQKKFDREVVGLDQQSVDALAALKDQAQGNSEPNNSSPADPEPMDIAAFGDGEDESGFETVEEDDEVDNERVEIDVRDLMHIRHHRYRRHHDTRTWRERIQRQDAHWQAIMPRLVNAYLQWRYPHPPDVALPPRATSPPSSPHPDPNASPLSPPSSPPPPPEPFDIAVLDLKTLDRQTVIHFHNAESLAEALVLNGYLSPVPLRPSLAISFYTLELLRTIRLFSASLSIEAFARLICYQYCIAYDRKVRNALSDAFDIYLKILRAVRKDVLGALGRDTPNWRVLNGCPACSYEVHDERRQAFGRMYCMDGNSSLKRMRPWGGRNLGDERVLNDSDYFLSPGYVDEFANEVRVRASTRADQNDDPTASFTPSASTAPLLPIASNQLPVDSDTDVVMGDNIVLSTRSDVEGLSLGEPPSPAPPAATAPSGEPTDSLVEGDPTDGCPPDRQTCTHNWKAAQADEKKRSWGIFDENGIFASACPHGLILWIIDMVRSGELAKYPLATVHKVVQVFGERTMGGYDIGCSLDGTIRNSPKLRRVFAESKSRLCVGAFHGYSHEYSCQVTYHPNMIDGLGLEDFETMERIFSRSNKLAAITRFATAYRRRLLMEAYFQQWDDERYQSLGKALYDNYRQALHILATDGLRLADAMCSMNLTPQDLCDFGKQERNYVLTLGEERDWDLHAVAYVEALQELKALRDQLSAATQSFLATARQEYTFLPPEHGPTEYAADLSRTRKIETCRRHLDQRCRALEIRIAELEVHLQLDDPWTPASPEYVKTLQYIETRKYQDALRRLQRLVVQRLFELHKMNLAGTGYRLRQQIAKNLQSRSRAIRNALNVYNAAAQAVNRPQLEWGKVSHYQFLEDFELLNDTHADVAAEPWAAVPIRETVRLGRRVARAAEELEKVHDQARRVHTAMHDEARVFTAVLDGLRRVKDPLYGAVLEFVTRRQAANACVMSSLKKLYHLPKYAGPITPGIRAGAPFPVLLAPSEIEALLAAQDQSPGLAPSMVDIVQDVGIVDSEDLSHDDEDEEDESLQEELSAVTDFIANLAM